MGQFAVPLLVLSTAGAIQQTRVAAGAQEVELENQKRKEAAGARDREIQRKRRTAAIIGAQAANAAAKGVQLAGSVANISIEDAKRASEESLVDEVNTRTKINALSRRQRTVGRLANINTATSIFKTGARIAERG